MEKSSNDDCVENNTEEWRPSVSSACEEEENSMESDFEEDPPQKSQKKKRKSTQSQNKLQQSQSQRNKSSKQQKQKKKATDKTNETKSPNQNPKTSLIPVASERKKVKKGNKGGKGKREVASFGFCEDGVEDLLGEDLKDLKEKMKSPQHGPNKDKISFVARKNAEENFVKVCDFIFSKENLFVKITNDLNHYMNLPFDKSWGEKLKRDEKIEIWKNEKMELFEDFGDSGYFKVNKDWRDKILDPFSLAGLISVSGKFRKSQKKWKNASVGEVKKFLAALILLGLNHTTDIEGAFSNDENFANAGLKKIISKRRFTDIKNGLVFDLPYYIEEIQKTWRDYWILSCFIAFDETIIPFKGKCWFKQYIRGKPGDSTGIKFYSLADHFGFFWYVFPYLGYQPGFIL